MPGSLVSVSRSFLPRVPADNVPDRRAAQTSKVEVSACILPLHHFIHPSARHNGVVIEPTDGVDRRKSMGDEDPHSSASRSHSRSRTPSSKENPATHTPLPPTTVPPGGPQSYYRQHTFAGGEYMRLLDRLSDTSLCSHGPSRDDGRWSLSSTRWSPYF